MSSHPFTFHSFQIHLIRPSVWDWMETSSALVNLHVCVCFVYVYVVVYVTASLGLDPVYFLFKVNNTAYSLTYTFV